MRHLKLPNQIKCPVKAKQLTLTGRTLSPWRRPSTGFKVSNTWPYLALSSTCQPTQNKSKGKER